MSWRIIEGDCRDSLRSLDAGSVQTCVTSPPYFGLRDYRLPPSTWADGWVGCLGLEPTPEMYVAHMVEVFEAVRRVLRDDGTVWLNLGDSYNNRAVNRPSSHQAGLGFESDHLGTSWRDHAANGRARMSITDGDLKEKDLLGVPWMVAFALRADGWYLRSDIIWSKLNPMPESVRDRPTKAHEYLFLLSKGPRYFYDADAIREDATVGNWRGRTVFDNGPQETPPGTPEHRGLRHAAGPEAGRNKRSVWTVATQPYPGAHFATFPPKLIEPCILAGCPERACGECGAPWTRITERVDNGRNPNGGRAAVLATGGAISGGTEKSTLGHGGKFNGEQRTTGFEPSCGCHGPMEYDNDTRMALGLPAPPAVPGAVLDPFAGAGTTGMVALRHGRSFVGCELSPEYVRLARDRIIGDAPLLNSTAEVA